MGNDKETRQGPQFIGLTGVLKEGDLGEFPEVVEARYTVTEHFSGEGIQVFQGNLQHTYWFLTDNPAVGVRMIHKDFNGEIITESEFLDNYP